MRRIYCGNLNDSHVGKKVKLCGWVNSYRNLGNLLFVNLRDREGIIQVVFDSKKNLNIHSNAKKLRNEFCLQIIGIVSFRPRKQINHTMKTGNIEVLATKMNIINVANSLPIDINQDNFEENRLKFRYLDLRKSNTIQILKKRSKIIQHIQNFLEKLGFINVETPILSFPTSEGAKDYLVSSRTNPKKFYALPQSPQIFKQLLMISGLDRYYQIAKCFRDEDLRSDRQPEFTQVDIEASFVTSVDIQKIAEKLIKSLWKNFLGISLHTFQTMTYSDAISRFGTDKPDLRNPIELIDIKSSFSKFNFGYHLNVENRKESRISAIRIPYGKNKINKKMIQKYSENVKQFGIKELFWIRVDDVDKKFFEVSDSVKRNLNKNISDNIIFQTKSSNGDFIFFILGDFKKVSCALNDLRTKIGYELDLIKTESWIPLWITDFFMFEKGEKGKLISVHNPFASPKILDIQLLKNNPIISISNSYDLVINGREIGSGSVRIHNKKMQETVFDILGITRKEQKDKFGFFLDALQFGTPPHAGFAFGLDRLIMLLNHTENIRDVIAFPKTTAASDLMTNSPSFL